jgi:hypothetical protein
MQVVPVDDMLVIEASIQPADIDQLHIGPIWSKTPRQDC